MIADLYIVSKLQYCTIAKENIYGENDGIYTFSLFSWPPSIRLYQLTGHDRSHGVKHVAAGRKRVQCVLNAPVGAVPVPRGEVVMITYIESNGSTDS